MPHNCWEAEHIRLRGVEPADWELYQQWDRDTEASRLGWHVPPPGGSESLRKTAREHSEIALGEPNRHFIIETLEGTPAGLINAHGCDRVHRSFEYGIMIAREHWGSGYGPEAIAVLLRNYFGEYGFHKVTAWVYAFNARSMKLHERLGMVHEGTVREAHFADGRFHDVHIYGMTAPEFFARYGDAAPGT